ncbi:MAG: methyltransferase domain-containing protein [Oscillospiraceae bacterium]|jgi:SAM-dependent methyltransferase|nr:methyltransferase domain-containing protein [Oscillospiraceae bacterium]
MNEVQNAYAAAYVGGEALCSTDAYGDLHAVPEEVRSAKQGCGSPIDAARASIRPGMTVLDLGCGAGTDCFLAAESVGATGNVVGVDFTPEALAIARRNARANMRFIETDFEKLPLDDSSVDVVISNCALNLASDKAAAFAEIYRVLKSGGCFVISDIAAFQSVPNYIRGDREMISRCIGGAMEFKVFAALTRNAGLRGFGAVNVRGYARIDGLDFVSATVTAHKTTPARDEKPKAVTLTGPMLRAATEFGEFKRGETQTVSAEAAEMLCLPYCAPHFSFETNAPTASIPPERTTCKYTGSFAVLTGGFLEIEDDDGHTYRLGEPLEVCDKTAAVLAQGGYRELITIINRAAGRGVDARDMLCGDGCCC